MFQADETTRSQEVIRMYERNFRFFSVPGEYGSRSGDMGDETVDAVRKKALENFL